MAYWLAVAGNGIISGRKPIQGRIPFWKLLKYLYF